MKAAEQEGGWWCKWCMRFTEINQDREMNVCAKCGRPGLQYKGWSDGLTRQQARELFEQMRKAAT